MNGLSYKGVEKLTEQSFARTLGEVNEAKLSSAYHSVQE